jgi:hypothetical protein
MQVIEEGYPRKVAYFPSAGVLNKSEVSRCGSLSIDMGIVCTLSPPSLNCVLPYSRFGSPLYVHTIYQLG